MQHEERGMILDGHIHIFRGDNEPAAFLRRLEQAGVDGGIVLSLAPPSFAAFAEPTSAGERLDELMTVVAANPSLYPFYWVDPMEGDAVEQVEAAVERGAAGFKIICHSYAPSEARAMDLYRRIAAHGKPILFHSGILADTTASSRYNRPAEFECLLDVQHVRFALAHLAWPWCDELIAVYYKFSGARSEFDFVTAEMFVDLTPGTPPIYRRDALTKLYGVGCHVEDNVFFGSDRLVHSYNAAGVRELIERDTAIFNDLGLTQSQQDKVFSKNLLRFIGVEAASGQDA